ncbi:MAG: Lrp/AsnC family transcriptional regulator [Candidatus Woesearchaeota archaeon]
MDETDEKILEELTQDARKPFLQIAKKLKVSEGTIRKRVNDMVKNKHIKKFTINVTGNISAIVGIQTNPHVRTDDIVKKLKYIKVHRIYELTGRFDILCLISSKTMEKTNEMLESIRSIEGIQHTETFTVLNED